MNFEKLKKLLEVYGEENDLDEYIKNYEELKKRNKKFLNCRFEGEIGDSKRIKGFGLALRQMLHHRAKNLYEGSLDALMQNNIYLVALGVRGHFETTAAIGYLCSRLHSFSEGNIGAEIIDDDICNQFRASKEKDFWFAPDPQSILKQFDFADNIMNKLFFNADKKEFKPLRDNYEFLCEFCHPNFLSNKLSYDLDENNGVFIFRYEGERIEREEFSVIGYILISAPLFLDLFDLAGDLLDKA
jgi:hypothetical protein